VKTILYISYDQTMCLQQVKLTLDF